MSGAYEKHGRSAEARHAKRVQGHVDVALERLGWSDGASQTEGKACESAD